MSSLTDLMPLTVDVDAPKPCDMPENVQQILCLKACGFSLSSISRLAKISASGVYQNIKKYDPEGKVTLNANERKRFIAKLWEARVGEALLSITSDKLENASAKELAGIASIGLKSIKTLQAAEEDDDVDPLALIEALG